MISKQDRIQAIRPQVIALLGTRNQAIQEIYKSLLGNSFSLFKRKVEKADPKSDNLFAQIVKRAYANPGGTSMRTLEALYDQRSSLPLQTPTTLYAQSDITRDDRTEEIAASPQQSIEP